MAEFVSQGEIHPAGVGDAVIEENCPLVLIGMTNQSTVDARKSITLNGRIGSGLKDGVRSSATALTSTG